MIWTIKPRKIEVIKRGEEEEEGKEGPTRIIIMDKTIITTSLDWFARPASEDIIMDQGDGGWETIAAGAQ